MSVYKVVVQGLASGDVSGFVEGSDVEAAMQKVLSAYNLTGAKMIQVDEAPGVVIVPDAP